MRVLLDEMVSRKLASQLGEHEVTTVQRQGWAGLTNGHLLDAIDTLFDVFITMDKGIRHQQRLAARAFGVIEVRARSNDIDDVLPLVPQYDHILNFAWSCSYCNDAKGGRPRPRTHARVFDPRFDHWPNHFAFSPAKGYIVIVGLTAVGHETVRTMGFHTGGEEGALVERSTAIQRGLYPPPWLRVAYSL